MCIRDRNTRNAVVTIIEEHSGVSEITYTIEPDGGSAVSGTAAVKENRAQLPISEDFAGIIRVNCEDAAGHRAKELVLRAQKEELETQTEPQTESEGSDTEAPVSAVARASYTVKAGDTLAGISEMYYGSLEKVEEICALNGIDDENTILPGQKILLP